jgi:hypothetical protein
MSFGARYGREGRTVIFLESQRPVLTHPGLLAGRQKSTQVRRSRPARMGLVGSPNKRQLSGVRHCRLNDAKKRLAAGASTVRSGREVGRLIGDRQGKADRELNCSVRSNRLKSAFSNHWLRVPKSVTLPTGSAGRYAPGSFRREDELSRRREPQGVQHRPKLGGETKSAFGDRMAGSKLADAPRGRRTAPPGTVTRSLPRRAFSYPYGAERA